MFHGNRFQEEWCQEEQVLKSLNQPESLARQNISWLHSLLGAQGKGYDTGKYSLWGWWW